MPTIPRPRCSVMRCTQVSIAHSSMCADHAPVPKQAPSREGLRQYKTSAWSSIRQAQLSRQPLCQGCKDRGLIRAASVVDHVWPWRSIGQHAFRANRFQSCCHECHSVKTGLEQRGVIREYGVRDWTLGDYEREVGSLSI